MEEELAKIHCLMGQKIKAIRKEKKLTSEELAERSGLSVTYISRLENGKQSPTLSALYKIAKGMDTSLLAFFSFV
ncbi:TPA: helix-turn-helix domain-containing protein [Vibrio parahaemolyticus]